MVSNKTMKYVDFARFCINYNLDPLDTGELLELARKSFRAAERACNSANTKDTQKEIKTDEAFEQKALSLGFDQVIWAGLWPTLKKNGATIFLPQL